MTRGAAAVRAERQLVLRAASDRLRAALSSDLQATVVPWCHRVDRAHRAWHWVAQRPLLVAGVVAAVAVARPRSTWRWAGRAWAAWSAWRRLQALWAQAGVQRGSGR